MIRRSVRSTATGAARTRRPTCCRFRLPRAGQAPVRAAHISATSSSPIETVAREAAAEGKPFDHHLAHLAVHGFLHLLGYDHENDREAREDGAAGAPHPGASPSPTPTRATLNRIMADSDAPSRPAEPAGAPNEQRNLPVPVGREPTPTATASSRGSRARCSAGSNGPTRADIEVVLEAAGPGEAGVSPEERTMIKNILALRGRRIEDVMVPRGDIIAVQQDITLGELVKVFEKAGHSRLVAYNDTLDDPVGMVHIRDLIAFMTAQGRGRARQAVAAQEAARRRPRSRRDRSVDAAVVDQDHARDAVRAAVDAGARPAREDAGDAHPSGAGGRRIRRHRRPRLDGGHRRADRRRHRRRA